MKFDDKELLKKYLVITKDILILSLKSQTNKNFIWGLIINDEDIEYVKNELDFDFIPFNDNDEYFEYVKNNKIDIQTRHDIDDWMSSDYVDIIQKKYMENINDCDIFLVQSQPIKMIYKTKKETSLSKYTDKRTSMHLSLCQKEIIYNIHSRIHAKMHEISKRVITLPEGYTKWVIHGDNISVKNKLI